MRQAMLTVAILVFVTVLAGTAWAQRRDANPEGGFCPVGTCAKDGGKRAKDPRNCSAKNCAQPVPKSNQKR